MQADLIVTAIIFLIVGMSIGAAFFWALMRKALKKTRW